MTANLNRIGAITLFVDDLRSSRSFYQAVFGGAVIYEDEESVVFDFTNTIVNLLKTPAARALVEPGTVAQRGTGARFLLSVWVDDADETCAELERLGVGLVSGPVDREWGKRTASFTDPDGNIWEIAQDIPTIDGG